MKYMIIILILLNINLLGNSFNKDFFISKSNNFNKPIWYKGGVTSKDDVYGIEYTNNKVINNDNFKEIKDETIKQSILSFYMILKKDIDYIKHEFNYSSKLNYSENQLNDLFNTIIDNVMNYSISESIIADYNINKNGNLSIFIVINKEYVRQIIFDTIIENIYYKNLKINKETIKLNIFSLLNKYI